MKLLRDVGWILTAPLLGAWWLATTFWFVFATLGRDIYKDLRK